MEYIDTPAGTICSYSVFRDIEGVKAFTSTRTLESWDGPVSKLKTAEEEGFLSIAEELGLARNKVATVKQVHGSTVHYVTKPGFYGEGDGIVTDVRGLVIRIVTADCLPVFIYDTFTGAYGLVHAGWRGLKARIIENAIEEMKSKFNSSPVDIIAAIGPFIQKCCYEVGTEVAELFPIDCAESCGNDKAMLNLKKAAEHALNNSGIKGDNIEIAEECTSCENERLHSYRRDGDRAGRLVSLMTVTG